EEFALASHQRAVAAARAGHFAAEIVPYGEVTADECPRPDTSLAKMAALAPLREDGLITAALSSQIADAAAALLVASGRAARAHAPGPPLGATGARLLTTLLHALVRTSGRYGMVTMCEGGGQANVTILERC